MADRDTLPPSTAPVSSRLGVDSSTPITQVELPPLPSGPSVRNLLLRRLWPLWLVPLAALLLVVLATALAPPPYVMVGLTTVGLVGMAVAYARLYQWLERHVQRLETLERTVVAFAEHRSAPESLWAARPSGAEAEDPGREVARLSDGLQVLMRSVQRAEAAHRNAQSALKASHAQLETRVHERTLELEQARDEALQASRTKQQFLANMSHELRTPLSGLLGTLELLTRRSMPPDERQLLGMARQSGSALLAVINDVLDHAKIQAGKIDLRLQPMRPNQVVASVESMFSATALGKGLVLRCHADALASQWVLGDAMRLRQVLLNLVGNALKFTDHGSVELQLTTRYISIDGAPGVSLRFEVSDSGVGMEAADLKRLFNAFEQADNSDHRQRGGSGLGLSISQELVQHMGGHIEARSTPGQGSVFHFEIGCPCVDIGDLVSAAGEFNSSDNAVQTEDDAPENRVGQTGMPALSGRILLAEDNPVNSLVAVAMLEQMGLQVTACNDGQEAVEAWQHHSYDLVLMDCQMPVLDGFAATRRIRELESAQPGRRTPILALTANALIGDAQRCMAAGMDGHIGKPFTYEDFHRSVSSALNPRPRLERGSSV